jgi:hypothetical protein
LLRSRVNVVSQRWVETPMWDEIVGPVKYELTTGIVIDVDGGHVLI